MDGQVVDALRKARRDWLQANRNLGAFNAKQDRKPQPREPKGGIHSFFHGVNTFFCILGLILLALVGMGACAEAINGPSIITSPELQKMDKMAAQGQTIVIGFGLFLLIGGIVGRWECKWRIKKSHNKYLNGVYAEEVQEWQERMNEKQKVLNRSMSQYLDDEVALAGILPAKYLDGGYEYDGAHPVVAITQYLEDGRADTIKEAINLYENEEREARRDNTDNAHRATMQAEARATRIAQERAAYEQSQANARMARAQEDANRIAKRRASAAEEGAANARKSAEELETIRRIHTGERGV